MIEFLTTVTSLAVHIHGLYLQFWISPGLATTVTFLLLLPCLVSLTTFQFCVSAGVRNIRVLGVATSFMFQLAIWAFCHVGVAIYSLPKEISKVPSASKAKLVFAQNENQTFEFNWASEDFPYATRNFWLPFATRLLQWRHMVSLILGIVSAGASMGNAQCIVLFVGNTGLVEPRTRISPRIQEHSRIADNAGISEDLELLVKARGGPTTTSKEAEVSGWESCLTQPSGGSR